MFVLVKQLFLSVQEESTNHKTVEAFKVASKHRSDEKYNW